MVSSDKESKGESAVNQLNLSRTRGSAFSAFGVVDVENVEYCEGWFVGYFISKANV